MNEREFDIAVKGLHKTLKRTPMVLVTPKYLNELKGKLEAIKKIIKTPNTTNEWAIVQIMNLLDLGLLEESSQLEGKDDKDD